ncbi:MAG TPA: hypothetical protein VJP58_11090, partial [Candidatus Nitrosocosmicus sp.]|nr:hypothetical protein [Candidatus Nitrosocosmicus sp.]
NPPTVTTQGIRYIIKKHRIFNPNSFSITSVYDGKQKLIRRSGAKIASSKYSLIRFLVFLN